ncbi:hypothetical protein N800_13360 [Lysobacter daejeonensis GH1-9]|uniref:EF-hand domain-containing protein n=1 Tax=Lysobacter daejeonensis GH1-9 TaxID=1385517 RepID=A0A0A0EXK2_9GAMM|nr:EF-hand domain-containing protein [Lysobacter daejeonensis]KGM55686.1 hypothetical protein N800_13360 [Lysobacter daejeonensis GH1-9]
MKYANLAIAVMFAIASGPIIAGDTSSATTHKNHDQHAHGAPAATFGELDVNRDGRLSKAEMAKHPLVAHFGMVDANRDGSLSKDEFATLQGM